jgi:cytochrome c biogenesis factor
MRCPRLNAAIRWLKVGDTLDIAHYRLTFAGLFNRQGPNYHETVGRFVVRRMNGDLIGVMEPSRRNFPSRDMTTTEAALMTRGVSQLYLSLGDPLQNGNLAVRLFQTACFADLAWRRNHVRRRRSVVFRSAFACWCAAAGEGESPLRPAE